MRFEISSDGRVVRIFFPVVSFAPDPLQYKPVSPVIQFNEPFLYVVVEVPIEYVEVRGESLVLSVEGLAYLMSVLGGRLYSLIQRHLAGSTNQNRR